MKAIIPEDKIPKDPSVRPMQTPTDAKEAARQVFAKSQEGQKKTENRILSLIEQIEQINPEMGGMEEIAALLSLPEETFRFLAPVFIEELERSYHNVNNQLEMVQMMNLKGFTTEDVQKEYHQLCAAIDTQFQEHMSAQKRDFLKRLFGITYNALSEAEGVGKKTILIPIEFCHENAKMPAYANLTDAGMDVYALEDITIAPGETKLIPLGIKTALPAGYELQVRPKSGRCLKTKLRVANTPGTIDAGYREEICVIIDNIEPFIKSAEIAEDGSLYNVKFGNSHTIGKGEKFAQLVLNEIPRACFYEVQEVGSISNDGRTGGFGSTGLK
jgi:dUTP pyrophosphatase